MPGSENKGGAKLHVGELVEFLEDRLGTVDDGDDSSFTDLYIAYKQRGERVFKEREFKGVIKKLKEEIKEWE